MNNTLRDFALSYSAEHRQAFLRNLCDLLTIASISTDPDRHKDMWHAAEWIAAQLKDLDFENVTIFPTGRHPIVFGENQKAGPDAPTILIYGHYDVQPCDPLDLWNSPPFSPKEEGDYLFSRGASDMKGQVIATLSAIKSVISSGPLPINIKFLIEGEEEIGSPSLPAFLDDHKELLACDVVLNPDAGMVAPTLPTIVYALRGMAYFELRISGPRQDLHSGIFGGVVHNPAIVLSELIAGMHNSKGKVTLPGFYDQVIDLSENERQELARLPLNDSVYIEQTGVPALHGEEGYTSVERIGARPTLDVNGLFSGFTGPGSKTIIPAWAMAKISMRLVPNQNPQHVRQSLEEYLKLNVPDTVRWELISMSSGPAAISRTDTVFSQALFKALRSSWGVDPIYKREGGSVPIVSEMQKSLGVESVLTGFGLPDDNVHSPNERLHLPTWYKGIDALIHFFYNLSEG